MKRQSGLTAAAVVLVVAIGLLTWTKSASEEITMPNISTEDVLNSIPRGFIVAFGVKNGDIPNGWAICDGQNGTPNLKDKFLMGVTKMDNIGDEGGEKDHFLGEDVTAKGNLTADIKVEFKDKRTARAIKDSDGKTPVVQLGGEGAVGGNEAHSHAIVLEENRVPQVTGLDHRHNIGEISEGKLSTPISVTFSTKTEEESKPNFPPYVSVLYLMKL